MKKDTLYLHVGWSKTGTSAIQAQIQAQKNDFLDKGILYPETLQWPDHSHHPFALSFQGCGAYKSDLTPMQALEQLAAEVSLSPVNSVLMSSELSPFYFDNPEFKKFVQEHFSRVQVIFTVRCQSELMLSLFNQLVKDPNIKYGGSLFALTMRNISWMNFYQNVKRWHDVVGRENLIVVPYSKNIVEQFLNVFNVEFKKIEGLGDGVVNPSLPTRVLAAVQAQGRKAVDNPDFIRIRNRIITSADEIPVEQDRFVLFSIPEQQSVDENYHQSNKLLANMAGFDPELLRKKKYSPIKTLPPGYKF